MASVLYKLSLRPRWRDIEQIRTSVQTCCAPLLNDPEFESTVAMVCAELLENTVKHGTGTQVDFSIRIDESRTVHVEVTNEVKGIEIANSLDAYLKWIASFDSAQEAYLERMQTIFESGQDESGGLGLVRAAFEGNCALTMSTTARGSATEESPEEGIQIRLVGIIPGSDGELA